MKKTVFIAAWLAFAVAQAQTLVTTAHLSGPAENPPVDSPGTGFAVVTYDADAHTLRVQVTFSGLVGNVTASHIHGPVTEINGTAGVVTPTPSFPGFPAGGTSGVYDQTFDLTEASSYRAGFLSAQGSVAAAEAALAEMLAAGTSYLNIHSTFATGGEIRGFLLPDADADGVPDADDEVPNSRDVGTSIKIGTCDTGVPNVVFEDGSTISDEIYALAEMARNRGQFVSAVAKLKNELRKEGVLTAAQAAAIQSCAAKSKMP